MDKFGTRLRAAREAAGLTIKQLAARCYIGHGMIYRYERGAACPSLYLLRDIAVILGASVDWLIGLTDEGGPKA